MRYRAALSTAASLAALTGWLPGLAASTALEPFRVQDRWMAVGDSITHHGTFCRQVELFYLTRYPERSVVVLNAGLDGDTATGACNRIEWDLLPEKPTVVSIMLGMNDVDRGLYEKDLAADDLRGRRRQKIDDYERGLHSLVVALQGAGARVIVVSPSPFDNTVVAARPDKPGVNAALAECTRRARHVAAECGAAFVDLHGPMTDLNLARQADDRAFTIVSSDRTHPGPVGNLMMAYLFLSAQQVRADVADAVVDAATSRVDRSEDCAITAVNLTPAGGTFRYAARALPFPVEPSAAGISELIPFYEALDRERIAVRHLRPGAYTVTIDQETIGTFSGAELEVGVNLARLDATPQLRQARTVADLLSKKDAVEARLRNIAWVEHTGLGDVALPADSPGVKAKLAAQLLAYRGTGNAEREVALAHAQFQADKPLEGRLRAERDQLAKEARVRAQPVAYTVGLVHVGVRP